ncbi:23S rRNA (uracil-5-)-methyltransferase RumA, partial [human gut metagenome]
LDVNKQKGNVVLAGDFYPLWGEPELTDRLCGLTFTLSPQAFYQVNPVQAERLYERAVEYAVNAPTDQVLDLYCGAGTISLCLARKAAHVIGAEIVPEAIENARRNAERNGIENAEFLCADAGAAAAELARRGVRPDCIVVDPPRKGMSPDAIDAMVSMQPPRIVYVSCDPGTLARDVKLLTQRGYTLTQALAVDMFPQTPHVETVVLLSHKKPDGHINVKVEFGEGEGKVPL